MEKKVRRTEFTTMVSGYCTKSAWKRVYVDDNNMHYVKIGGEYKNIENTPSIDFMVAD